jgi:hypothetical protein
VVVTREQAVATRRLDLQFAPRNAPMMKRLFRIAPILLALAFASPGVAQTPPAPPDTSPQTPVEAPPEKTSPNPVPAFVVVFLSTLLILFIICRPARKI